MTLSEVCQICTRTCVESGGKIILGSLTDFLSKGGRMNTVDKIGELEARVDKYVLYTEQRLGDLMSRLDAIEECLTNVKKSEALVKWEKLYARLWNFDARLYKLESYLNLEVDE
jgi:hypothetical protein